VSVGGNSYDEEEDEVFVGEEPVEVVAMLTRWDEAGEDKVSWEERVDVGTGTVAATPSAGAVGARGNFIFGDTAAGAMVGRGAAIVGCAGLCCRADNSA